jgi:hypothetical protein
MLRSVLTSPRSQASCSVTKLRLAACRKPSVSKPPGTPQFCEPCSAFRSAAMRGPSRCARHPPCPASAAVAEAAFPRTRGSIVAHLLRVVLRRRHGCFRAGALVGVALLRACLPAAQRAEHHQRHQAASSAIMRMLPKPAPKPSECASHARPRPAGEAAQHAAPAAALRLCRGGVCEGGAPRCALLGGRRNGRRRVVALRHVGRLAAERAATAEARAASASMLATVRTSASKERSRTS